MQLALNFGEIDRADDGIVHEIVSQVLRASFLKDDRKDC